MKIIQNLYTGSSESFNDVEIKGQTFTLPVDMIIEKVTLKLSNDGDIGNVVLNIEETTSNLPNGSILGTSTINGNNLTSSPTNTEFNFSVTLSRNTTYALVIKAPDQAVKFLTWATSTDHYPNGTAVYSDDNGSNWDTTTGYDAYFIIEGRYKDSSGTAELKTNYPDTDRTTPINLIPEKSFISDKDKEGL